MKISQIYFVVTRAAIIAVIPLAVVAVLLNPQQAIISGLSILAALGIGTILVRYVIGFCVRVFNRYPDLDPNDLTIGQIFSTESMYWRENISTFANRLKR